MDKIIEILKTYTDIPVTINSKLIDDLGLDSFLIVYFLTEVEDCFGININESEFIDIITVEDVLERIQKAKKENSPQ